MSCAWGMILRSSLQVLSLDGEMESSLPESLSGDRQKVTNELIRGREFTQQLQTILQNSIGGETSPTTQDLALKIFNSFTNTIAMLSCDDSDEGSQIHFGSCLNSPLKSEDSGESCRSSAVKDRRGCYKRRKTSDSRATEDSTLVDDGHAWRKYGQKAILNSQFPRNYYRCTHKMDQGCQASKQVQRIQDDPPKYRTTYYGHHTCSGSFKSSEIILDSNLSDSSFILSFNGQVCNDGRFPFFSSPSSVKQEMKEEAVSDEARVYSSSPDYLLSPDLGGLDSSGQFSAMLSSPLQSFPGEIMSEVEDYLTFDY